MSENILHCTSGLKMAVGTFYLLKNRSHFSGFHFFLYMPIVYFDLGAVVEYGRKADKKLDQRCEKLGFCHLISQNL